MQPLQTISVGDRITVYREDRDGRNSIPQDERHYTGQNEYSFRAEVVELCPEKPYNYVRVIQADGTVLRKKRKAPKSKSFPFV
jgi:hypothetical protein